MKPFVNNAKQTMPSFVIPFEKRNEKKNVTLMHLMNMLK